MTFSYWIRSWKHSVERRWTLYQALRRKSVARRRASRPRLEALEDRWLLSTYTVTSAADDGSAGTLRYAINQANMTGSTITEIDFNIGTAGSAHIINLTSQLPTLTASGVYINGQSQGGTGNTNQLITLNGSSAGSNADGFLLEGANCTISGLIIEDFKNGIEIGGTNDIIGGSAPGARNVISGNTNDGVLLDSGANSNQVLGNYIGTNVGGSSALSNSIGIEIAGTQNTIGGSVSAVRNLLSGNSGDGILIDSTGSGNVVLGNAIGCNTYDTAALGNSGNGIEIAGTLNTVGGSVSAASNEVSSNSKDGLLLDSTASGNVVLGNYIGTDHTGLHARANKVGIEDAGSSNTLGGSAAFGDRNVIAANTNDGILLDSTAKAESVEDNYIGLNAYGNAALANGSNGVEVLGTANTIGGNTGTSRYFRNFISGNSKDGVLIDSGVSGNAVQGNWIGLGSSGTQGVANVNGIEIAGSSNTIGGSVSGLSNVISSNKTDGVLIDGTGANNVIQGNYAGPDYTGQKALANSSNGIEVAGTGNTVGGTVSAARNILSGNSKDGVLLDNGASSNQVLGNYIGTNVGGTTALSNSIGIEIAGNSNTIGGSVSGARNLLSGNTGDGVLIDSTGSGNVVLGNAIGCNTYDTAALGNSGNGIEVAGSSNTLGASYAVAPNEISSNSNDGILLDSTASGNQVVGNYIGTDHTGLKARANKVGIEDTGSGNTLGGSVFGARNVISGNSGDGVLLDSSVTKDVVEGNYIGLNNYGNAALANGSNGLEIQGTNNLIGGTIYHARNLLSGNGNDGLLLDSSASGNRVLGSFIGIDISGTHAAGNAANGVEIAGSGNTIGGITSAYGKVANQVIADNSKDGVLIDSGATGNLIQGNYIGTDYTGIKALANSMGVEVHGNNNTLGGAASSVYNVISGNSTDGILIASGVSGTLVQGNRIGTDNLGLHAVANGIGIEVAGSNNTIGVPAPSSTSTRNIISGNTGSGVLIDSSASGTLVQGNYIGVAQSPTLGLGNGTYGVSIAGSNNTIGGSV